MQRNADASLVPGENHVTRQTLSTAIRLTHKTKGRQNAWLELRRQSLLSDMSRKDSIASSNDPRLPSTQFRPMRVQTGVDKYRKYSIASSVVLTPTGHGDRFFSRKPSRSIDNDNNDGDQESESEVQPAASPRVSTKTQRNSKGSTNTNNGVGDAPQVPDSDINLLTADEDLVKSLQPEQLQRLFINLQRLHVELLDESRARDEQIEKLSLALDVAAYNGHLDDHHLIANVNGRESINSPPPNEEQPVTSIDDQIPHTESAASPQAADPHLSPDPCAPNSANDNQTEDNPLQTVDMQVTEWSIVEKQDNETQTDDISPTPVVAEQSTSTEPSEKEIRPHNDDGKRDSNAGDAEVDAAGQADPSSMERLQEQLEDKENTINSWITYADSLEARLRWEIEQQGRDPDSIMQSQPQHTAHFDRSRRGNQRNKPSFSRSDRPKQSKPQRRRLQSASSANARHKKAISVPSIYIPHGDEHSPRRAKQKSPRPPTSSPRQTKLKLPRGVTEYDVFEQKRIQKLHEERVRTIKPVIDTSAPKTPTHLKARSKTALSHFNQMELERKIQLENHLLMKRLENLPSYYAQLKSEQQAPRRTQSPRVQAHLTKPTHISITPPEQMVDEAPNSPSLYRIQSRIRAVRQVRESSGDTGPLFSFESWIQKLGEEYKVIYASRDAVVSDVPVWLCIQDSAQAIIVHAMSFPTELRKCTSHALRIPLWHIEKCYSAFPDILYRKNRDALGEDISHSLLFCQLSHTAPTSDTALEETTDSMNRDGLLLRADILPMDVLSYNNDYLRQLRGTNPLKTTSLQS